MKHENHTFGSFVAREHLSRNGPSDDTRSKCPALDTKLQSHLGRTLRRVYESEIGASLPQDLRDLLQQLDSIPTGARCGGEPRRS